MVALLRKTEGRLKDASTEEERLKRACTVHAHHLDAEAHSLAKVGQGRTYWDAKTRRTFKSRWSTIGPCHFDLVQILFLPSRELNFPKPYYQPACHSTSSENESWYTSYPRRLALLVGSLLLICLASPANGQGGFGNFIQNLFRPIMRWKITVNLLFFC